MASKHLSAPIGPKEIIISSRNFKRFLSPTVDGEVKGCGLRAPMKAKYDLREELGLGEFDLPLIPESEWEDRLALQIKDKAQLSDIRNSGKFGGQIPATDQGGQPYCWAHSSTSAILMVRALNNQPYIELSAYAVACIIKNYRSSGGWSEESLKFIAERGIPDAAHWPIQSKQKSNDNPETWANAKRYRFSGEWMSLSSQLMKKQLVTCLLSNIPVCTDLNWWSHAICTIDLVSLSPFRTRILNSWGNGWSQEGTGILEGSKAIPDDALAPRVATGAG